MVFLVDVLRNGLFLAHCYVEHIPFHCLVSFLFFVAFSFTLNLCWTHKEPSNFYLEDVLRGVAPYINF